MHNLCRTNLYSATIWHFIDSIYATSSSLANLNRTSSHAVATRKALSPLSRRLPRRPHPILPRHAHPPYPSSTSSPARPHPRPTTKQHPITRAINPDHRRRRRQHASPNDEHHIFCFVTWPPRSRRRRGRQQRGRRRPGDGEEDEPPEEPPKPAKIQPRSYQEAEGRRQRGFCVYFSCFARARRACVLCFCVLGGPAGPVFCVFVFWAGTTGLCFVFSCFGSPPSKHSTEATLGRRAADRGEKLKKKGQVRSWGGASRSDPRSAADPLGVSVGPSQAPLAYRPTSFRPSRQGRGSISDRVPTPRGVERVGVTRGHPSTVRLDAPYP
jgi:hypothetical protein